MEKTSEVLNLNLPVAGRGRPALYKGILDSLAPGWLYTSGLMAELALLHGFHLFLQPEPVSDLIKKNRIRIALGRYHILKTFPSHGDQQIVLRGRFHTAWYGWRWQCKPDVGVACRDQGLYFKAVLANLDPPRSYSVTELVDRWLALEEFEVPKGLLRLPEPVLAWQGILAIQARIFLTRKQLCLGLDPTVPHLGQEWQRPLPVAKGLFRQLIPFIDSLDPNSVFMPHQILKMALSKNYLSDADPEFLRALSSDLYEQARLNLFPEIGDVRVKLEDGTLVPAWAGSRWNSISVGDPLF